MMEEFKTGQDISAEFLNDIQRKSSSNHIEIMKIKRGEKKREREANHFLGASPHGLKKLVADGVLVLAQEATDLVMHTCVCDCLLQRQVPHHQPNRKICDEAPHGLVEHRVLPEVALHADQVGLHDTLEEGGKPCLKDGLELYPQIVEALHGLDKCELCPELEHEDLVLPFSCTVSIF